MQPAPLTRPTMLTDPVLPHHSSAPPAPRPDCVDPSGVELTGDVHEAFAALRLRNRAIAAAASGITISDAQAPEMPLIFVNAAFERMSGYTQHEVLGRNCRFLQGPDTDPAAVETIRAALRTGQECQVVLRNYRKNGTPFWVELLIAPVRDATGQLTHFIGVQNDITSRVQAEQLGRRAEYLTALHETALALLQRRDPTALLDDIVARAAALVGTPHAYLYLAEPTDEPERDEMAMRVGRGLFAPYTGDRIRTRDGVVGEVWHSGHACVVDDYDACAVSLPAFKQHTIHALVGVPLRVDNHVLGVIGLAYAERGRTFDAEAQDILQRFANLAALALDNARLHSATQYELAARRHAEAQLTHQAFHDALTGLPNRALFLDRLTGAVARAARRGDICAVLFLDLDRFKPVNDSLGHEVGDQLLVATAGRLCGCLRDDDTVARLGGDEFTVLLEGLDTLDEATRVAERIIAAMQAPFTLAGHEIAMSASIGIALSTPDQHGPADMLRNADIAMYHAKHSGKRRYALFDGSMGTALVERLALEADLRHALERNEFVIHYQPKVEFSTGRIEGVEALVRWQHPRRGLVSPAAFVPVAEEVGLIVPLGRWVLEQACQQLQAWHARYPDRPPLTMNVNLSARQFQEPDLLATIADVLRRTGIPPHTLHLEITESLIMADAPATIATLAALKELGVGLAIDDFGTGYSSLSYLRHFPVDTLKIDKSFIAGLGKDREDTAIVRSVLTMALTLGLGVVAEGVETADALDQLHALGCNVGQGYYFAQPCPPHDLEALLHGGMPFPDAAPGASV